MSEVRLKPAELDLGGEERRYLPRLPWIKILLGLSLVAAFVGSYVWQEAQKERRLRQRLRRTLTHEIKPYAAKVAHFHRRLFRLTQSANQRIPTTWAHPQLRLIHLRQRRGVYLRIPQEAAQDPKRLAKAAVEAEADRLTACLGLRPTHLASFFAKSGFFRGEGWTRLQRTEGMLELRVLKDEIRRRSERDLPLLLRLSRSEYFWLVLERGKDRFSGPVDFFIWDLSTGKRLLQMRAKPHALKVIRAQLHTSGAKPAPNTPTPVSPNASLIDCGLAAQLRTTLEHQSDNGKRI
ncbi:MAG: hypothetical protein ACPGUV_01430 [Polyangiales bacterium]